MGRGRGFRRFNVQERRRFEAVVLPASVTNEAYESGASEVWVTIEE